MKALARKAIKVYGAAMLDLQEVNGIVTKAALAALGSSSFLRAVTEPTSDSDGRDAWLITLVIHDPSKTPLAVDAAGDAIVRVQQDLLRAGEDRTAIIEFSTENEMMVGGGS